MDFRAMVRKALAERKMSVYRLAKEVGYKSPDPIYKWLNRGRGIRLDRLERILHTLDLSCIAP